jgi:hypothetical protein
MAPRRGNSKIGIEFYLGDAAGNEAIRQSGQHTQFSRIEKPRSFMITSSSGFLKIFYALQSIVMIFLPGSTCFLIFVYGCRNNYSKSLPMIFQTPKNQATLVMQLKEVHHVVLAIPAGMIRQVKLFAASLELNTPLQHCMSLQRSMNVIP